MGPKGAEIGVVQVLVQWDPQELGLRGWGPQDGAGEGEGVEGRGEAGGGDGEIGGGRAAGV